MHLSTWIIEDEPLAIDILKEYIKNIAGLELGMVFNNPSDLDIALNNNMVADLVLMDINIGNGKTLEYITIMQSHCRYLILTTAYPLDNILTDDASADRRSIGYLHKPFSFDTFLAEVKRVVTNS